MKDAEMPVPDHLWSGIASRLPEAVVSGGAAAGKAGWGITQWVVAAVTAGAISTGVYFLSQDNPSPVTPSASVQQTDTPEETAVEATEPEHTGSISEDRNAPSEKGGGTDSRNKRQAVSTAPHLPSNTPSAATSTSGGIHDNTAAQSATVNAPASGNIVPDSEPSDGNNSFNSPPSAVESEPLTAAFSARQVDAETLRWLFIPQEDNAKSYTWDFGDGHISGEMAGAHSYTEEGTFEVTLTVTDEEGNSQKSTLEVDIVKPAVIRPANIFTPNGDSRNDLFDPLYNSTGIVRGLEWAIFDNSNRIVFSSESQFTWDGRTMGGDDCPDDTYRYYIKALDTRGNPVEKSGLVRLMR